MKIEGNKVILTKKEYFIKHFAFGSAIDILSNNTKMSEQEWIDYLVDLADKTFKKMQAEEPKAIDKTIKNIEAIYQKLNA